MRLRALLAAALAALACAPALAAAQAPVAPGSLTVALDMPSDGFQVGAANGRQVVAARGFEVDLARAIAGRLAAAGRIGSAGSLRLVQEQRFARILAPQAPDWDMALAQVTITDARRATVDFSIPYLTVDQGVLLSLQTLARPSSIADLRGMRLCAQGGSTGADLIASTIRPTRAPLLPASVVTLTRALRIGSCEALVYDAPSLAYLRAQVPSRYGPFAGVIPTGERYGAVFPKGSRLRGHVNRAITALQRDGTIAGLQRTWLTADLSRAPVLR